MWGAGIPSSDLIAHLNVHPSILILFCSASTKLWERFQHRGLRSEVRHFLQDTAGWGACFLLRV